MKTIFLLVYILSGVLLHSPDQAATLLPPMLNIRLMEWVPATLLPSDAWESLPQPTPRPDHTLLASSWEQPKSSYAGQIARENGWSCYVKPNSGEMMGPSSGQSLAKPLPHYSTQLPS